jgi:hypothetical protein
VGKVRLLQSDSSKRYNLSQIGDALNDPMYTMTCFETIINQDHTVFLDLDFSAQNGFSPDQYMILFKIKSLLTGNSEVINLFENNLYGSYNEIPLMPDARFYIMKENFKFTIRILAVHQIEITIMTQYYKSPYFNDFYSNKIIDCDKFITQRVQNKTIQDILSTK